MTTWWRDAGSRATVVFASIAAAGFVVLGLAWRGVADGIAAPLALPWLVSGGLGGAALIGAGIGFLDIHLERRRRAEDRVSLDIVIDETEAFVARAIERRDVRRRRARSE